ncbi:EAL domain-containing protein [Mobilitalea sibirica]|uniref:EAL domain-containing protein n=1 Tax=Mobilitalea sibirica TaxID=1462919 RepID=A0A8J7L068_9FIRM|nr:EAL domain-containing protein [Mobilitalea sibirica]MBH1941748.1 EAL domain-containing protein [Mobilitalea sibirica]
MNNKRYEALEYIIKNKKIKTVFQPIISLKDGCVLGHEALSRITCDSMIENPEMLFSVAGTYNRLWDLELLCRTTALEAAYKFMRPPYNKILFINVNPNTMHDENFKKGFTKEFLMQYNIRPNNVIFEITEKNAITDMEGFLLTINHYRSQNYKIAIDDAGAGYSGLNLISDVNPNYIKLDMKLIRGIDADCLKYALVKGLVELSKLSNIALIAEGIETYEELKTLIKLGVQYGQGYYIQKPDTMISEIREEVQESIMEINLSNNLAIYSYINNYSLKSICTYTESISPNDNIKCVNNVLKSNKCVPGLCVVDDNIPIGIIMKDKLALRMKEYDGSSLYEDNFISSFMEKDFLSVDVNIPIFNVSKLAMLRKIDKLYDIIVVTEYGKYIGILTIKALLETAISCIPDNIMQRIEQWR